MKVENAVHPSEEQMAGFAEPGAEGPIYMLNLLKYKDKAEYPDGSDSDLSGREAYQRYGLGVLDCLASVGAEIIFNAGIERLMLGDVEELWDDVAIAKYPSRQAMLEMTMSEAYQAIHVHREAGLAGQLNIECTGAIGSALGQGG